MANSERDELCINTLRFLAVDMVEAARSGHPGLPLGAAACAYTVWNRFLKINPADPAWPDRDRFVLSAGHGSALLYALLHLSGFDLPLSELRRFRQWESLTPGHPEHGLTPGVEATTGPLGQGLANAVGMAIAEQSLGARFNRPDHSLVDHFTYVMVSDGDLMEGISSEAASLAGHLRLGKLIVLYDDNHISIEGRTDLAFTEDRPGRFAAFGWHVQQVPDGNDVTAVAAALAAARAETQRPSFIAARTSIGYGSPHKQDTSSAHGEPLGFEECQLTKQKLGWPLEPGFHVPELATEHMAVVRRRGAEAQLAWQQSLDRYTARYPDLAAEFQRVLAGTLPEGWDAELPRFTSADGPMATRAASGKILNSLARRVPELLGGSADLAPSTKTLITDGGDFAASNRSGRNLRFGVREHAMGAILNGLALHGGLIPFGGTFLIFSDYMRPPMRLAAMNRLPVIYVFTHDSLGVGEDGPTHQPVEQLLALRAIPGLKVMRPADANETVAAWKFALGDRSGPVALVLSRQNLPILSGQEYPGLTEGVGRGGYLLAEAAGDGPADIALIGTGSEISLVLAAREVLQGEGVKAQVVSLPCWELFQRQSEAYRQSVLPTDLPWLAVEAGVTLGWRTYLGGADAALGVDRFGASAPGALVLQKAGLTVQEVCARAHHLVSRAAG